MFPSAISTVLTPAFRLLLFCFTAFRSSVIVSFLVPPTQPPLPVPVVADRLKGLHLHQAALKPFKILRLAQLAVQTRRTRFQRVLRAGNQVFHVQQHAKIPAERGAILMCDAGELLHAECSLGQPLRQILSISAPAAIAAFSCARPSAFFSR